MSKAQLQAGGSSQPGLKLRVLGRIAERWLDLGETERAQNLLREARELAKTIPPPAYEAVAFAESLARVDLEASLTLIAAARDSAKRGDRVNRVFVFDRSYGEIAYRLARSDPARAERVLGLITSPYRRDGYIVATCSRMALADLSRSQRVAATIDDPFLRAYAHGAIAGSLSATDKAAAARMLDQAFDDLEKHRDDREGYSKASRVAAVLLEAVGRVDPAQLQESVWRAVALRAPRIDDAGVGWTGRDEAELALNLARYDRAAAAAVLAPAVAAFGTTDVDTHRQAFIAMALVLIDPLRAVSMVEALPDDPGLDYTLPKNAARKMAAEMLAKHGDDRWKAAREWAVSIWRPVGSDL